MYRLGYECVCVCEERTIQAAFLTQKANFFVRIASHQAHDNGFFLASLEAVDAS